MSQAYQVKIQKDVFLDLSNPLDFITYILTEKRKRLMEETEKFKQKIDEMVKTRIDILTSYGYTIKDYKLTIRGILYYSIEITIDTKTNMFFDLPSEYSKDGTVTIDGHEFAMKVTVKKWGTDNTVIDIYICVYPKEFKDLFS